MKAMTGSSANSTAVLDETELLDEGGLTIDVAAAVADIDKTAAAALGASESVLQAALTKAGTIRLTITPKSAAGSEALLTESTVSVDIPVTV